MGENNIDEVYQRQKIWAQLSDIEQIAEKTAEDVESHEHEDALNAIARWMADIKQHYE